MSAATQVSVQRGGLKMQSINNIQEPTGTEKPILNVKGLTVRYGKG